MLECIYMRGREAKLATGGAAVGDLDTQADASGVWVWRGHMHCAMLSVLEARACAVSGFCPGKALGLGAGRWARPGAPEDPLPLTSLLQWCRGATRTHAHATCPELDGHHHVATVRIFA